MNLKILIAGGTCSGKSTLARCIASHLGYPITSFGGCLREYATEMDLPLFIESLQQLGQGLIDTLGYDGFLQWIIEHSPHIRWDDALILDGVRHTAMYESISSVFPTNVLICCVCDQETQLTRLMNRDKMCRGEAERIISHPLERFISELEPQATLLFRPGDSMENLLQRLDVCITKL
jgi:dephospho-CoA kinase